MHARALGSATAFVGIGPVVIVLSPLLSGMAFWIESEMRSNASSAAHSSSAAPCAGDDPGGREPSPPEVPPTGLGSGSGSGATGSGLGAGGGFGTGNAANVGDTAWEMSTMRVGPQSESFMPGAEFQRALVKHKGCLCQKL